MALDAVWGRGSGLFMVFMVVGGTAPPASCLILVVDLVLVLVMDLDFFKDDEDRRDDGS